MRVSVSGGEVCDGARKWAGQLRGVMVAAGTGARVTRSSELEKSEP